MLTLISEARFWTNRDIKDNNYSSFSYSLKNTLTKPTVHNNGKSDYASRRGLKCYLDNKNPTYLRKSLQKLEAELKENSILFCEWRDNCLLQLMISNGLLIHICVNINTGDILRIAFDKYFVGKLISDSISNVVITRMHIIVSYNENQITFVYLQKPNMKRSAPVKISRMEPKIFNIIVGGPQGRKLQRYLSCNKSCDLLLIWTKSSQNEVYPWRPTVRDQDRANIHVYKFNRTKLELLCYHWTEYDPICVEFSNISCNQFKSVEQRISKKGDVTVENCTYEIVNSQIQRISVTSIPLQTQVCCHSLSPDYEKLLLGCIDGSVLLFDEGRCMTHHVKAAFIPSLITWHCDSALVMIANDRGQLQCFDISLSCVKNQLMSEDMTPSNVIDLSGYFNYQSTLSKITWSKKPDLSLNYDKYVQTDTFLLLVYENGPISGLRFVGGAGLKGDIHTSGLTADILVSKYLLQNHVEKAINILLCLNWDTYGAMCLISLHKIASYIFKQPLNADRELQLQKALGSFHIPVKPLCYETENEFGDQVRDITRKFFFYMLRYKSYETAFSLAIDINDVDLFMDLYNSSKLDGLTDLPFDCIKKAEEIYNRPSSTGSNHSTCTRSSCSVCSGSIHSELDESSKIEKPVREAAPLDKHLNRSSNNSAEKMVLPYKSQIKPNVHPPLPTFMQNSYVPPLPYFNNEINMNEPKPDLVTSYTRTLDVAPTNVDTLFDRNSSQHFSSNQVKSHSAHKRNLHISKRHFFSPLKQSHVVLDVIPKPKLCNVQLISSVNKDRDWSYIPPDQTLGIPLTNYQHLPTISSYSLYPNSNIQPEILSQQQKFHSLHNTDMPIIHAPTVPVIHQHPLVLGNIPQISNGGPAESKQYNNYSIARANLLNKESVSTNSILTNSNSIQSSPFYSASKKEAGERNKVKFSDTITVAVVPEIPRKEKHFLGERLKRSNGMQPLPTDPRRELAESLPLCHPNDDYLKDFNPVVELNSSNSDETRNSGNAIKVIHFGVV